MSDLAAFRKDKDAFFAHDDHSPLTPDQRRQFHGLAYFDEDPLLAIAAPFTVLPEPEHLEIELSTGESEPYLRWATVEFRVAGEPVSLTVFQSLDRGDLFLPFKDATSSAGETYGGGRYLDPFITEEGLMVVDFNYAYNPYCAYNEQWSCPIPPPENVLSVPIRAGEKAFAGAH